MSQLSNRYAVALFELAKDENQIDVWQVQTKEIASMLQENVELLDFLKHVLIMEEDKKEILNKVFGQSIHKHILHFMFIIVEKRRCDILLDCFYEFNHLCNKEKKIEEGIVYSMKLLDDSQVKEIEKAMEHKFSKKIALFNKIDLNLISGIKVVLGNLVVDGSLRNQMNVLKENLQKESR